MWVKCNEAHKSLSIMISMLQKQKRALAMISFFNRYSEIKVPDFVWLFFVF